MDPETAQRIDQLRRDLRTLKGVVWLLAQHLRYSLPQGSEGRWEIEAALEEINDI